MILIPSLAGVGGAEKLAVNLSTLLSAKYQVFRASFDDPASKAPGSGGPDVALGPIVKLPLYLRWVAYSVLAARLAKAKRELEIDVTISLLWGADLINILAGGPDRKIALGLINIANNPTNRLMVRLRSVVGLVYRRFDRVLAISAPLAAELRGLYRLAPDRLGTFRNFVEAPQPRATWAPDGISRYVFCGRLVREKNLDGLLSAWQLFAQQRQGVQLVVLGDGPLTGELRELAGRLSLTVGLDTADTKASVLFLGTVKSPEDFMPGARAFVLSSRDEGVPTVLLLALGVHLPILAADSNSGGVHDLLGASMHPGTDDMVEVESGLLLPIPESGNEQTLQTWKRALERVEEDGEARARWRAGAAALSAQYSVDWVRKDWIDEIDGLDRR